MEDEREDNRAPGWKRDPWQRFAGRYWDGEQYTEQVLSAERVRSVDPVPEIPPPPRRAPLRPPTPRPVASEAVSHETEVAVRQLRGSGNAVGNALTDGNTRVTPPSAAATSGSDGPKDGEHQSQSRAGRPWFKRKRFAVPLGLVAGLFVLSIIGSIVAPPKKNAVATKPEPARPSSALPAEQPPPQATSASAPATTNPTPVAPTQPATSRITADQKAQVRAILLASVDHYQSLLDQGRQVLASASPYPDAITGLAAFKDPTSFASRWSDYRTKKNPAGDLDYLRAFQKADDFYTAANEPRSIGDWRDDMGEAAGDFGPWIDVATGWQISMKTSSELAGAEQTIRVALTKARADVDTVVAAS